MSEINEDDEIIIKEIRNMKELCDSIDEAFSHFSRVKSKCNMCKNESEGGRLICCGTPICYNCFDSLKIKNESFPNCIHCENKIGYVHLNENN